MAHVKTLRTTSSQWDHFDTRQEAETFLAQVKKEGRRAELHQATADGQQTWCVHWGL